MSQQELDLNVLPEGTVISSGTLRPQDLLRALDVAWNKALSLASVRNIKPTFGRGDIDNTETISAMADLVDAHMNSKRGRLRPVLTMYDLLENEPEAYEDMIDVGNLHEYASDLIDDLIEDLHTFIPDGCYVGMHEGDGSLLGVWRAED